MSHPVYRVSASTRQAMGNKTRALRRAGVAPAVLYGYRVEPTNLQLDIKAFEAVYREAGRTALVDLSIEDGQPTRVFVQAIQRHPVTKRLQHVDFHAVNLRQEITAEVPVLLIGESSAVHNNLGVLLRGIETVTVTSLPTDLPQHIEISVEGLAAVDDALHVSDLPQGVGYEITTDPSELLVRIAPPQLQAEVDEETVESVESAEESQESASEENESES